MEASISPTVASCIGELALPLRVVGYLPWPPWLRACGARLPAGVNKPQRGESDGYRLRSATAWGWMAALTLIGITNIGPMIQSLEFQNETGDGSSDIQPQHSP